MTQLYKLVGLAALLVLSACGGTATQQPHSGGSETVKYAYQPAINAPIYMAEDQGIFAKHGLNVEMTRFDSGPLIFPSLRSGSVDIADMAASAVLLAQSQGLDIKVFDVIYDISPTNILIAQPGSTIKGASDLKGKKVGAVKGSSAYYGLVLYLQKNGMSLNDIQYINTDASTMVPAFQHKDVDLVYAFMPQAATLLAAGGVAITTNAKNGAIGLQVLVGRADWLKSHEDAAKRFVAAHAEALSVLKTDAGKQSGAAILVQNMGIDHATAKQLIGSTPFPTIEQMAAQSGTYSMVSKTDGVVSVLKASNDFWVKNNFISAPVPNLAADVDPTAIKAQ